MSLIVEIVETLYDLWRHAFFSHKGGEKTYLWKHKTMRQHFVLYSTGTFFFQKLTTHPTPLISN